MKKIYILIGPKGSGKSYIGALLEKECNIYFFRVEEIWLKLKQSKNFCSEKEYFESIDSVSIEGYDLVYKKIQELLMIHDKICIESLGIGVHFLNFLFQIEKIAKIIKVRIITKPYICLENIKRRDQSMQIQVSEEKIIELNNISNNSGIICDYNIINNNSDFESLKKQFYLFLK